MPSIAQFIKNIRLDKADESTLVQHVQDCHANAGGPSLQDRCTERVRKYLKQNPPPDLSWHGSIKLEDELNAGFTSKQAFKMGIPAIGIVAVLVANVTFIAWATPPGGATPYWAGCDYPIFTSFLIVNGVAFMLAVASVIVVTAFPLLLKRTPHQAAWWGGILLLLSMLAFIAAFLLAGFVTVNYKAPTPGCASLHCDDGGILCSTQVIEGGYFLDSNVATLNTLTSASNTSAVCLQYDTSVPNPDGVTSILYQARPECPPQDLYTVLGDQDCPAVRSLLQDVIVQAQTVCLDYANFPAALTQDTVNFTITINASIANLTEYFYQNTDVTVYDLITANVTSTGNSLTPYGGLRYVCNAKADEESTSTFATLCDISLPDSNLSLTRSGEYMTEGTASLSGATVFHADIISTQVATAIEALSGFFGLVLLIIIGYLIRSKVKY